MGEVIYINNQNLSIKEFQNQRVVTFKDIDKVHRRADGTAKRNFNSNSGRFIEDEDYYLICKDEFRTDLWEEFGFSKFAAKGYLITETGYLMLVKSLHDDLAWEVQRKLIKNYFRAKEIVQQPKNEFDLMRQMIDQIESAQKEAHEAKQAVRNIKDTIIHTDEDWRNWVNQQLNTIGFRNKNYREVRKQSYDILENRARCRLNVRLNNLKERLEQAGAKKSKVNKVSKLDVIEEDTRLKEIYTSVVEKLVIKYSA